ncbi:MAG: SDR family NAD(P)-dependent oxidoreductase [Streptosporangiaceae bacterium]
MDLELGGKRALVTGSSSGLGQAIAGRLAAEGASVIIHGRDAEKVRAVTGGLQADGSHADGIAADLRDADQVSRLVTEVAAGGPIDILINNAGAFVNRGWEETTPGDWADIFETNVVSAVRLIHALVPGMRDRGWGRIIQLGTGEATNPFPRMPDYAASKAAIVNLTASLAKHLARTGITVNTVSPGIVVTPGVRAFYEQEAARCGWGQDWPVIEAAVLREILDNPTGRLGRPEEVADLVALVASPRAGYINGANLRIDGGSTAVI